MTDKHILEDPTNRIVSVFDDPEQAQAARNALLTHGLADSEIRIMSGEFAADHVDTSAKWFADTDEEIARYQRELGAGNTVISVPLHDRSAREAIHEILTQHDARLITHFGQWVTEMMK